MSTESWSTEDGLNTHDLRSTPAIGGYCYSPLDRMLFLGRVTPSGKSLASIDIVYFIHLGEVRQSEAKFLVKGNNGRARLEPDLQILSLQY